MNEPDRRSIDAEREQMKRIGQIWCEVCGASPRHRAIVSTADGGYRCLDHVENHESSR